MYEQCVGNAKPHRPQIGVWGLALIKKKVVKLYLRKFGILLYAAIFAPCKTNNNTSKVA